MLSWHGKTKNPTLKAKLEDLTLRIATMSQRTTWKWGAAVTDSQLLGCREPEAPELRAMTLPSIGPRAFWAYLGL